MHKNDLILNKQNHNVRDTVLTCPSTEQECKPTDISIFEHHITFLIEEAESKSLNVTNYFLEKALESLHGISV